MREREIKRPPLGSTKREAIRIAREIPFSVGSIWGGIGSVLAIQRNIALQDYRVHPNQDTAGRLALAQGRVRVHEELTPAIGEDPRGEILKFGIVSIFTNEVAAITTGGSVSEAIRMLHDEKIT